MVIRRIKVQGKNFVVTGFTRGAQPLANAQRVLSKRKQKQLGKKSFVVKNLSTRRQLARIFRKIKNKNIKKCKLFII